MQKSAEYDIDTSNKDMDEVQVQKQNPEDSQQLKHPPVNRSFVFYCYRIVLLCIIYDIPKCHDQGDGVSLARNYRICQLRLDIKLSLTICALDF